MSLVLRLAITFSIISFFFKTQAQALPSRLETNALTCAEDINSKNINDIEKVTKHSLAADIGKFCSDTAWGVLPYSNPDFFPPTVESIETYKETAEKLDLKNYRFAQPWIQSLVPSKRFKEDIFKGEKTVAYFKN